MLEGKKVHFIAIGGSVMHNLAICLHRLGNQVSGSDDMFFDPSKGNLKREGLLPEADGWHPNRVDNSLDYVILGMHAKADNPELLKAQELGLPVYSFPEFIYEASKNKKRVVVAGSHGKTSITSMIMHILKEANKDFDYLVGAQLEGFDQMVKLSNAPVIIIEGDEYTTSPLDLTPKFLHYHHDIACISGIAWDHFNVFPTFENYKEQFRKFVELTPTNGTLYYYNGDQELTKIIEDQEGEEERFSPYSEHPNTVRMGKTILKSHGAEYVIEVFGKHNMENLQVAKNILVDLGITESEFYQHIKTFSGAAKRLEKIGENENTIVFKDFAHAPSKLKATSTAVHEQFPDRQTFAVLELHTFSSLNPEFIDQYAHAFDAPENAVVFINPEIMKKKGFELFTQEEIRNAFQREDLLLLCDAEALEKTLLAQNWKNKNLLFMSSGNYGGLNLKKITATILES
ncbi:UDP-N-acetylmuramate--L-alanine ligase [Roseivirga pacifica]|uniref:UDP-N-acetylmuramate--L-alanine ligase n=1 Tax=Roseivirga pacifica TaxID=1267423 RepID=UPI003BAF97CE